MVNRVNRTMACRSRRQGGVTIIEVLVTLLIIALGLLGLAGLEARLQSSEMESYQRAQALVLLDDMVNRLNTNRADAANYADAAPLTGPMGVGMTCPTSTSTQRAVDMKEWCNALQGAAELSGSSRIGAMIGGRGCIEDLGTGAAGDQAYQVTVAWQGMTPLAAPTEGCGQGSYNGPTGSLCQNDRCRRAVSVVVRIGNLS